MLRRRRSKSIADGEARRATLACDRRADRDRPDREDVEVEAQHRRPRRDHRRLRRRHGALVHAVRLAARARRDLDRGRRQGRLPLRAADLAVCRGRSPTFAPPCDRSGVRIRCRDAPHIRKIAHRALAAYSADVERLRFNRLRRPGLRRRKPARNGIEATLTGRKRTEARSRCRPAPSVEAAEILVQLIAPMMPHLAEECWAALGHSDPDRGDALAGSRARSLDR